MLTLDEFNTAFGEIRTVRDGARVSCPRCKQEGRVVEMILSQPGLVLLTYPGQERVHCPSCNYRSTKVC